MKYLGINLIKHAQDLYPGNRTLPREMKEEPTTFRDMLCSRVRRLGVAGHRSSPNRTVSSAETQPKFP